MNSSWKTKTALVVIGTCCLALAVLCYDPAFKPLMKKLWRTGRFANVGVAVPTAPSAAPSEAAEPTGSEPELPRVYLDTGYATPTRAPKLVAAGADLQAALNAAQPGDVISLQAGATFTGNFTLPVKTGSGWIIVRTSAPDSSLPAPGTRITPAYAGLLPKILSPNDDPALTAGDNAHHYRLIGIELSVAADVKRSYGLLALGDDSPALNLFPHDLIVDRVYIHGNPNVNVRRGVALNSTSTAIIDSYISDCHEIGADAQAVAGWTGPGPYKIVNNYLEASGENFILGGADPDISNLVPSDIEFRQNLCSKPLSWKLGHPSYAGVHWSVKNLFELKNARRVLVDGNIFENNWADSQSGFAILFTVRNQDGGAPWSAVQDVTFTNNIVRHSGSGLNMHGEDDLNPSVLSRRIKVRNNLFEDINGETWSTPASGPAGGRCLQIVGGITDVMIDHNTMLQSGPLVMAGDQPSLNDTFTNNLALHNLYGISGDGTGPGNATLDTFFPGVVFQKNAMVGADSKRYPANNFFPALIGDVGFVNYASGNYRLKSSSVYKHAGTDGKDLGCDFDALSGIAVNAAVSISAANYRPLLAPESIMAAFGTGLATETVVAATTPLPTSLAGTTLRVRDRAGIERLSPLFFVSPTQVNYIIPQGTATGAASIIIASASGSTAAENVQIAAVAPGIFTADNSGRGVPTASVLRVKPGNVQQFEPVGQFDATQNKWLAVPIDLGPVTDQVFLVLFGTGWRYRSTITAVTALIGGAVSAATFAGPQGESAGLDQINLPLPRNLSGRGEVDVVLTVDGQIANTVRVNIK